MATVDVCIVWFRRDLRLYDNPALVAALNSAKHVVPLFVWAPEEEGQFQPGRQTRWWNKHSVLCLSQRLQQLGSRLIVRRAKESVEALKQVVQETGAQAVFFNNLYDSISMVRDQHVKDEIRAQGVLVSTFNADLLYEPWEVLDDQQQPYTTFKAYWDRCLAMPYAPPLPLPEPSGPLPAVPDALNSLPIREVDWFMSVEQEASTEALTHRWDPSGQAAVARLETFLQQGLPSFEHDRAKTDRESTTMLSPWIHFGTISVRHIYYRVAQKHAEWQAGGQDKGKSCLDFLQQMGYREYSRYLAFHFPFITERSMLAHLRAVPWRLDQEAFKAWRQGLTGYPLVDAGMRQLWCMGWCHNRVRVVASHFLVKHLLLPWQWGLKHLWDCQIDADLECDALGWQYVSGCLSDAHPFSYLVDLEAEWKRFDPDGHYVRRWLPVLSQLPAQFIHQPWKAPPHVLEEAGVELGFNYPWPIITAEAAKEGVAWASAVVERCAANSSGGSGSSSGTGFNALMPRKEPYRPPTDPALMSSFLAAAQGSSASWQQRLPPLYIHSACGHPLSMHYSAQQRPYWGPSMHTGPDLNMSASACESGSASGSSGAGKARFVVDRAGRRYCLRAGPMGQQQLMLTGSPEGSASMSDSAVVELEASSSGSGRGRSSESGDSFGAAAEGGAAAAAAAGGTGKEGGDRDMQDEEGSEGLQDGSLDVEGAGQQHCSKKRRPEKPNVMLLHEQQHVRMQLPAAVGVGEASGVAACSSEEQVVPSLCEEAAADADMHKHPSKLAAGGFYAGVRAHAGGRVPRHQGALVAGGDVAREDDGAVMCQGGQDEFRPRGIYEASDSWGMGARPAGASLSTACSNFVRQPGAAAAGGRAHHIEQQQRRQQAWEGQGESGDGDVEMEGPLRAGDGEADGLLAKEAARLEIGGVRQQQAGCLE